jgi:hypothetical protein
LDHSGSGLQTPTDIRPSHGGWRFIALWVVYGFALVEALYFAFRPGGLLFFGLGFDHDTYFAAARDWLAGRGFYESYQVAGPYLIDAREILYPPLLLAVLVPFSFLPDILWVVVPAALTAFIVWSWRPTFWPTLAIGLCLAWPSTSGLYLLGSPGIWAVLAVAAATRWGWAGPLVLVKPSLFPFALVGIRTRAWWVSLVVGAILVLVTLPMWVDYLTVLLNARGPSANILYGLWTVPVMFVPVLAWLGRGSRDSRDGA